MAELDKILVVDDNPKYFEEVLPYYGYEVVCAYNGEEAINILETTKFDIVLLDIMMPKKNGWDTLKEIRKNPYTSDIPIIMVTGISDTQKMVKALKMGADDYVTKPFLLPNLLARIEAVLRRTERNSGNKNPNNVTINQLKNLKTLTEREKDVLLLLAQGLSNKEIADKLVLSEVTVKCHLNNTFKKIKVTNRSQAILFAMNSLGRQEKEIN